MKITIVGDTLLDVDIQGVTTRTAPDSGAPVVDIRERITRAGGAGLVASMLREDGHDVTLVTALSHDDAALTVRQHLKGINIVAATLLGPTPQKIRLSNQNTTVCRMDEDCEKKAEFRIDQRLIETILASEAVIVSDYGRGLVENLYIRTALYIQGLKNHLVWDPHPKGAKPVSSATLITPNFDEAEKALQKSLPKQLTKTELEELRQYYENSCIVITQGNDGATILEQGKDPEKVATQFIEVDDPCGAGDRFAATALIELSAGNSVSHAVKKAVDHATRYLANGGVKTFMSEIVVPKLLEAAPRNNVLPQQSEVHDLVKKVRSRNGTVVATGGCFDLLHPGHVKTLQTARSLGDCLIVFMNSDSSVQRLKGKDRPLIKEIERAELINALNCVDAVVLFDENTPMSLLEEFKPDIWVKGGDYEVEKLPETSHIQHWGGEVVILPYHLGHSTTRLVEALELLT